MTGNTFLPQFKLKAESLFNNIQDKSPSLLESYAQFNQFISRDGKNEEQAKFVLERLFNTMADQLQTHQDQASFNALINVFDFLATRDNELRKEINEMKALLNQNDAKAREEGKRQFFALLRDSRLAQFSAALLSRHSKTREEKLAEISERSKKEFANINETLVNQSIYSGFGSIGVQFVNLLHTAIHIVAAKAGYDLPLPPEAEGAGVKLMPQSDPKLPRIPVT